MGPLKVFDLATQKIVEEKVYGGDAVKTFYANNFWRGLASQIWFQKSVSQAVGAFKRSSFSKSQIAGFLKTYGMSLEDYDVPRDGFQSFNDFFIRKKKKVSFPTDLSIFPSPCEARLTVSRIEDGIPRLKVKGQEIPLPKLLGRGAKSPVIGWALNFRLCPVDYHRFHFVDSGKVGETTKLGTMLHSVNPLALEQFPKIFEMNERQVTVQKADHYGDLIYVEVGAMCVGRIHQTFPARTTVERGQEKGFFDFGGSTVVLIVPDGVESLKINPIIEEKNKEGFEVVVRLGEQIGTWG